MAVRFYASIFAFVFLFSSRSAQSADPAFEKWLSEQFKISYEKLSANISPKVDNVVLSGVVIASPSRSNPDYFYHWTRDAALVMRSLFYLRPYTTKAEWTKIDKNIRDFVAFTKINQSYAKGEFDRGNLGEPKFYVDGRPFDGPWARPQNDGPGLRALMLAEYALYLLKNGNEDDRAYVKKELYRNTLDQPPIIKKDLEYTAHRWKDSDFDLWEETQGQHLFTRLSQFHGLVKGAELADRLGDPDASAFYVKEAKAIHATIMKKFWSEERGHLLSTINRNGGIDYKSHLDVASILGLTYMRTGNPSSKTLDLADEKVVATAHALNRSFQKIYAINSRFSELAPAIGRYPEDVYDGNGTSQGNPWFLATLGMAEYNYKLARNLKVAGAVEITDLSLGYYKNLSKLSSKYDSLGALKRGVIKKGDPQFGLILAGLRDFGDSFILRTKKHMFPNGSMSEQMNRESGNNTGAKDLTWNYAAFITAVMARLDLARH